MITTTTPDTIWTNISAIFRWDPVMCERPGTYRVVMTGEAFLLALMGIERGVYVHPTCVVDDFGNLVKIPS